MQDWRLDFAPRHRQFRAPPAAGVVGFKDGMRTYLSFETPVADIDARIDELRASQRTAILRRWPRKSSSSRPRPTRRLPTSTPLTPWQKTQVARVQGRPHFSDYLKGLIEDFVALAGDRYFGEDDAIVGGLGRFEGQSV